MARRAKPCYHKGLGLWYARIGGPGPDGSAKAVYAPREVRDEGEAWAWFHAERRRRAAEVCPYDPANMTVERIAQHYLYWAERRRDEGKLSPAHYAAKACHLGLFAAALGPRVARTLSAEDANRFIGSLEASRYKTHYRANIMASVDAAMNWAVKAGHLAKNPVAGHDPVTVPRAAPRYAPPEETAALLRFWLHRVPRDAATSRHDRSAILLVRCLIRTGARPKELCRLRWDQVRWDDARSTAGHPMATAILLEHKTAATGKPRTIYFSPMLTDSFRRERGRPGRHPEYVFTHGRGRGGRGAGEPWKDGSIISKKVRDVRRAAIAEAERRAAAGEPTRGLERIRDEGPDRVHNYRFRHTAISTLLRLGVDVPTIAELTGTSPQLIHHTYGHLMADHLARAAERLAGGRD